MRSLAAVLLLASALSVSAQSSIAFHVELTDARTALRANPNFADLNLSEEQLEKAAKDRVMMLDKTSGTKWTWLILSWPEGKSVEHGLNVAGVGAIGKNADLSLAPLDAGKVQVRCLRERCVVNESVTLKKDETHTVAFGTDVKVEF